MESQPADKAALPKMATDSATSSSHVNAPTARATSRVGGPLYSYVSEPPSSLAAMRNYAQELVGSGGSSSSALPGADSFTPGSSPTKTTIFATSYSPSKRGIGAAEAQRQLPRVLTAPRPLPEGMNAAPHPTGDGALRRNLLWFDAVNPMQCKERVLEHPVAGDLMLSGAAAAKLTNRRVQSRSSSPDGKAQRSPKLASGLSLPKVPSLKMNSRDKAAEATKTADANKASSFDLFTL
jgi:hypothetical protein